MLYGLKHLNKTKFKHRNGFTIFIFLIITVVMSFLIDENILNYL